MASRRRSTLRRRALAATVALVGLLARTGAARADDRQNLVDKARMTVESFVEAPEMAEMRRLLPRARAVLVVPQFLKIGYVVGGAGGSGVLLAKDPKSGRFSLPAFYTLGSGGIGLQLGATASEVVLVILTERGLAAVLKDKFKLGVEVNAAIGPVGLGGEAATTSNLDADIVSFARSKGFFLGLSLEGTVMQPRTLWNEAYYGKKASPSDILLKQAVQKPAAAPLVEAVRKAATPIP